VSRGYNSGRTARRPPVCQAPSCGAAYSLTRAGDAARSQTCVCAALLQGDPDQRTIDVDERRAGVRITRSRLPAGSRSVPIAPARTSSRAHKRARHHGPAGPRRRGARGGRGSRRRFSARPLLIQSKRNPKTLRVSVPCANSCGSTAFHPIATGALTAERPEVALFHVPFFT
jgi:hypothetical protein